MNIRKEIFLYAEDSYNDALTFGDVLMVNRGFEDWWDEMYDILMDRALSPEAEQ